jgi:hypothetical protein
VHRSAGPAGRPSGPPAEEKDAEEHVGDELRPQVHEPSAQPVSARTTATPRAEHHASGAPRPGSPRPGWPGTPRAGPPLHPPRPEDGGQQDLRAPFVVHPGRAPRVAENRPVRGTAWCSRIQSPTARWRKMSMSRSLTSLLVKRRARASATRAQPTPRPGPLRHGRSIPGPRCGAGRQRVCSNQRQARPDRRRHPAASKEHQTHEGSWFL